MISDKIIQPLAPSPTIGAAPAAGSSSSLDNLEVVKALASLDIKKNFMDGIISDIMKPFDIKTPPEKVKKRPDGYDYVKSSYLDFQAKSNMPLYKYSLLHVSIVEGNIIVFISLENRVTGNVELGAGAERIQVRAGTEVPTFRDIIDMGNSVKAALTEAIKNAQSRFGFAADVYQKRESVPTEDERLRFDELYEDIKSISLSRAQAFKEGWVALGTGWREFMDKWQVYVDRNKPKKAAVDSNNNKQSN